MDALDAILTNLAKKDCPQNIYWMRRGCRGPDFCPTDFGGDTAQSDPGESELVKARPGFPLANAMYPCEERRTPRKFSQHTALQQARMEQKPPKFQAKYAHRSGIEGTISQEVRGFDMRTTRDIGLAKTHLKMLAPATAITLPRWFDWWEEKPRAKTRVSPFAQLAPPQVKFSPWWATT